MKKLCLILTICLLFGLAGCGDSDYVRIDDHAWEVVSVEAVDSETYSSEFVACSPIYAEGFDLTGLVEEIDLKVVAENGKLTITDNTNGVIYEGTYEQITQTGNSTSFEKRTGYNITVDGFSGMATTHNEISNAAVPGGNDAVWAGEGTPVLQITMGGYSLYCMEEGFLARKLLTKE